MEKIEFGNLKDIWYIFVLVAIVLILVFGELKRKKILQRMNLVGFRKNNILRWVLSILGVILILIALIEPRVESGVNEIKGKGTDIYLLVDTSKSMLGTDVVPSRIDRAVKSIESLIDGLEGDRIGIIPYATSAYIQMPLTDDYDLAKMFLGVIDTDMIGGGGTDVAQAINLATDAFGKTGAVNKAIIIYSDGEELDTDDEALMAAVKESGIKIFTVGIGTTDGSLIPIYGDDSVAVKEYKKDDAGELVVTKLDETMLKEIANVSNGLYLRSTIGIDEVPTLLGAINDLEKGDTTIRKQKTYKEYYQWFLGLGIVFILAGNLLPAGRRLR